MFKTAQIFLKTIVKYKIFKNLKKSRNIYLK